MSVTTRSIARIAAMLDLFERERRPLASQEIASSLGIPRSSLGSLLKALCELGWLANDRRHATYFPGSRLARVTGWMQAQAVLPDRLRDAVEHLRFQTGETVNVIALSDLELEVVYVSTEDAGIQLVVQVGTRFRLWGTSAGTACLAQLADTTIRSMHGRALRKAGSSAGVPPLSLVLELVRATRRDGYMFADSAAIQGVAAAAAPLPDTLGTRPMVISVGGPSERIRAKRGELQQALLDCVASLRNASPPAVPSPGPSSSAQVTASSIGKPAVRAVRRRGQ